MMNEKDLKQLELEYDEIKTSIDENNDFIKSSRLNKLLPVWERIQKRKDEKPDLTLKEYQEFTGRKFPKISKRDKFKRIYVEWDNAIDNVVTEYGYKNSELLYAALEKLGQKKEDNKKLATKLKMIINRLNKAKEGKQTDKHKLKEAVASIDELQKIHKRRSQQAQKTDELREHSITIDNDDERVIAWLKRPGSADIISVDTPSISGSNKIKITPKTPRLR